MFGNTALTNVFVLLALLITANFSYGLSNNVAGCSGMFCERSDVDSLDREEVRYLAEHLSRAHSTDKPHPLLGGYIGMICAHDASAEAPHANLFARVRGRIRQARNKAPGSNPDLYAAPAGTNIFPESLPLATAPMSSWREAQLAGPYAGLTVPFHPALDFVVVIDAGSQGSRVHIMGFTHRVATGGRSPWSTVFTHHSWSAAVRPGVSSFVNAPEQVSAAVQPLIDWAVARLVHYRARFTHIPVFLKATAGMRVIHSFAIRDRIMNTIRDGLDDHRLNPFFFRRGDARVISGEEEAVYGWLTVNYLMGTLLETPAESSYGVLDLGGNSAQIAAKPPNDVLAGYFPVRFGDERLRLYAHSFLYMGYVEALRQLNNNLIYQQLVAAPTGSSTSDYKSTSAVVSSGNESVVQGDMNRRSRDRKDISRKSKKGKRDAKKKDVWVRRAPPQQEPMSTLTARQVRVPAPVHHDLAERAVLEAAQTSKISLNDGERVATIASEDEVRVYTHACFPQNYTFLYTLYDSPVHCAAGDVATFDEASQVYSDFAAVESPITVAVAADIAAHAVQEDDVKAGKASQGKCSGGGKKRGCPTLTEKADSVATRAPITPHTNYPSKHGPRVLSSSVDVAARQARVGPHVGVGGDEGYEPRCAPPQHFLFRGTGLVAQCRAAVTKLLRRDAECWTNTCSFAGVYQPRFGSMAFVATSAYYKVVVEELQLPWDTSLLSLRQAADRVCALSLESLNQQYAHVPSKRRPRLCFHAQYVLAMLRKGFGLQPLGSRILFLNNIQGWELDWALGSALYEVNTMPWDVVSSTTTGTGTSADTTPVSSRVLPTSFQDTSIPDHGPAKASAVTGAASVTAAAAAALRDDESPTALMSANRSIHREIMPGDLEARGDPFTRLPSNAGSLHAASNTGPGHVAKGVLNEDPYYYNVTAPRQPYVTDLSHITHSRSAVPDAAMPVGSSPKDSVKHGHHPKTTPSVLPPVTAAAKVHAGSADVTTEPMGNADAASDTGGTEVMNGKHGKVKSAKHPHIRTRNKDTVEDTPSSSTGTAGTSVATHRTKHKRDRPQRKSKSADEKQPSALPPRHMDALPSPHEVSAPGHSVWERLRAAGIALVAVVCVSMLVVVGWWRRRSEYEPIPSGA